MSSAAPPEASRVSFLQYTGIPLSLFKKRLKPPSRNWLIFLSASASLAGLYLYDRRKCKQIRNEYVEKVKYLSEEPLPSLGFPRKVTVYGSKWPGDEDADKSMKYFRKYVKPILVAAAVDYEVVNGKHHGSLADIVADKIKSRRRVDLGLDPPPAVLALPIPGQGRDEQFKRELEGGIIIVGRQTFKEFMHGLKRGWSEPLDPTDKEELLSRELQSDGVFDEVEVGDPTFALQANSATDLPSNKTTLPPFHLSPLLSKYPKTPRPNIEPPRIDPALDSPPSSIPPYPPILLVSFTNLVGFSLVPRMIWDFFNQRRKVREGAKSAYRLVSGTHRPIRGPSSTIVDSEAVESNPWSDVSFDLEAEQYYRSSALVPDIEKARTSYYEELPAKIKTARELARGEREPSKDEKRFPPPTEVELRAERMDKELRWRRDVSGWAIVNPAVPVAWDPRFANALSMYVDEEALGEDKRDSVALD